MLNLPKTDVKAKCKKCGGEATASDFRMDVDAKLMVCPTCFKNRNNPPKKEQQPQASIIIEQDAKSTSTKAGWDEEDELLERMYRKKQQETRSSFKNISTDKLKYTCQNCSYSFTYDPVAKKPKSCAYCDRAVPDFF